MRRFLILTGLLFAFTVKLMPQGSFDFEVSKNLDIYSSVLKQLNLHYVDDIQTGELNKKAIEAMLRSLDPYTVYYPESKIEDVRYLRTGKYGGVGAAIHIQNDTVVVGRVLENYPFYKAGIRPGDRLLKIDGLSVVGKTVSQMSEILKGNAGSVLKVEFLQSKSGETMVSDVKREEIKIKNVPYYGFVADGVAYVHLSQFNETAAAEIRDALAAMSEQQKLTGFVLDLRDNGGGLLQQAVEIMDIFLPPGQLIVETKGKVPAENHRYLTSKPALYPGLPVVVLVNNRSASASEIVAGSFQDIDRGVVMGVKTYGKGLVQKVFPLSYNAQMKVTVAKYYIASGRCIQAIDYSEHDKQGHAVRTADSLRADFKTLGGRPVKDAGGILPDVRTENNRYNDVVYALAKQHFIFNYATLYVNTRDSVKSVDDFRLTDKDFDDFLDFINKEGFSYETPAVVLIEELKASPDIKNNEKLTEEVKTLEKQLEEAGGKAVAENKADILNLIRQEIISRFFFDAGKIKAALENDDEVKQAVELLNDKEKYDLILKPQ